MALLLGSICFEGLGRKFLPFLPAIAFYFAKDFVLLGGLLAFGVPLAVRRKVRELFGSFTPFLTVAVIWTVLETLNPEQAHMGLALVGLRAYWLWWLAPLLVAGCLADDRDRRRTLFMLAVVAIVVSLFGAYQFALPHSDALNTYALYEGNVVNEVDTVHQTGRVRVSSTFSYLSGFAAFAQTVPFLLLSLGIASSERRQRLLCLAGAALAAGTVPMSGSRGAFVMVIACMLLVMKGSGLFSTRLGRRLLVGTLLTAAVALLVFPDAVDGVVGRFQHDPTETRNRSFEALDVIPLVAVTEVHGYLWSELTYPLIGVGTGMMQNAAQALGVGTRHYSESETGRYIIELGFVGYVFMWLTRLGLAVALLRAAKQLRRHGQGPASGAAVAYALLGMMGRLTFDHVYQALYFFGVGLILHAVMSLPQTPAVPLRRGGALPARPLLPQKPRPAGAPGPRQAGLPRPLAVAHPARGVQWTGGRGKP
jgi:hypothetical protein